tara:strand:- start:585 stop:1448 length:864 start_codon:yes stop_codon:yes gene_type:complete
MVDGKDNGTALDALAGNAFFSEPLAIVVDNPTKDTNTILQLAEVEDDTLRVVLIHSGTLPKNSKLLKIKNLRVAQYQNPSKPWEVKPHATEFAVLSAREMGTPISKPLADSLVSRVGADLATVWWEIKKASTLAKSEGGQSIDVKHIKQTIAAISEVGPDAMLAPLEKMSAKKFLQAAFRVQKHSSKDPTMWTCAMFSKRILLWLAVAQAVEKKVPLEQVAERLGKNSWYLKNQILQPSKRWGSRGCAELLSALATAENSVKSGAAAPFNSLICSIADAINRHGGTR